VKGFNLDLPDPPSGGRDAFISDYAITPPALPKRVKVFTPSFCGLPYVEISGNAPDPPRRVGAAST